MRLHNDNASQLGVITKQLRNYQGRIVSEIGGRNSIVVLPTGTGKTPIACALMADILQTRSATRILFVVPTVALMEQQAAMLANETGLQVVTLGGGKRPSAEDWSNASIMVTLPAAFMHAYAGNCTTHDDNERNVSFRLEDFGLVVFDEVHHMIKDDPYVHMAEALATEHMSNRPRPQILGLTASITYHTKAYMIRRDVKRLARLLQVRKTQLLCADEEELVAGGYHGNPETTVYVPSYADKGDMGGGVPVQPDLDLFLKRLDPPFGENHARLPQLAICLCSTMRGIEDYVREFAHPMGVYKSPVTPTTVPGHIKMDVWAKHAIAWGEEATQPDAQICYELLEHFYTAVRLMVTAAKLSGLEFALHYLVMEHILPDLSQTSGPRQLLDVSSRVRGLLDSLTQMWREQGSRFGRLKQLHAVLSDQKRKHGTNLRCIVYFQQRLCTHIAHYYLRTCADGIRTAVVYGSGSVTRRLGLSPRDVRTALARFADGRVSILLSTSVTEEGLDIPAANTVIRYDSIQTPTSLVQSRGRARADRSDFVVMGDGLERRKSVHRMHQGELAQMAAIKAIAAEARINGGVESDNWSEDDEKVIEREYARETRKDRVAKRKRREELAERECSKPRNGGVPEWDGTFVYGKNHLEAGGTCITVKGSVTGEVDVCLERSAHDREVKESNEHQDAKVYENATVPNEQIVRKDEERANEENGVTQTCKYDKHTASMGEPQVCVPDVQEVHTRSTQHTPTRNYAQEFLKRQKLKRSYAQPPNTAGQNVPPRDPEVVEVGSDSVLHTHHDAAETYAQPERVQYPSTQLQSQTPQLSIQEPVHMGSTRDTPESAHKQNEQEKPSTQLLTGPCRSVYALLFSSDEEEEKDSASISVLAQKAPQEMERRPEQARDAHQTRVVTRPGDIANTQPRWRKSDRTTNTDAQDHMHIQGDPLHPISANSRRKTSRNRQLREDQHSNGCLYVRGIRFGSQILKPSRYTHQVDIAEWSDAATGTLSQAHMTQILQQCEKNRLGKTVQSAHKARTCTNATEMHTSKSDQQALAARIGHRSGSGSETSGAEGDVESEGESVCMARDVARVSSEQNEDVVEEEYVSTARDDAGVSSRRDDDVQVTVIDDRYLRVRQNHGVSLDVPK